jgi:mRNA interferase HigB
LADRWGVRVIAKSRLRAFWQSRKHDAETAERDLSTWYKIASKAEWAHFAALKQTFGSADQVGNCVVFDVGNNRYRLIGRVIYAKRRLYVLKVMDHAEYDRVPWAEDCGCYKPAPKRSGAAKKGTPAPRGRKGGK